MARLVNADGENLIGALLIRGHVRASLRPSAAADGIRSRCHAGLVAGTESAPQSSPTPWNPHRRPALPIITAVVLRRYRHGKPPTDMSQSGGG
jgi:hypothetical protein